MEDPNGQPPSKNEKLKATQQILAEQFDSMRSGNQTVDATAGNMLKAKTTYEQYGRKIVDTTRLVDEIQRKERWDEMKL